MSKTHYAVLGVAPTATQTEIKAAYRQAILSLHPDKALAGGTDNSKPQYEKVQAAWQVRPFQFCLANITVHLAGMNTIIILPQVLRDSALKQQYDQQLALEQLQQQVFISQTITVDEMQSMAGDPTSGEDSYLAYPCRCGGCFQVEEGALDGLDHSIVVQCNTCSLHIQVLQHSTGAQT